MIHVEKQSEPPHFFETVQQKGERFLLQNPLARGKALKDYWTEIIPDLYDAYSGICAYTCHKVYFDTGWKTVEHFKPKDKYPELAYRWDNYRFACGAMNGRKGTFEDVLDPFTLEDGWFVMHFPSLLIMPGKHLTSAEAEKVNKTIWRLKLNSWDCVKGRKDQLQPYARGKYSIDYLAEIAPFIAREIKRLEFDNINHTMWVEYHKT